MALVIPPVPAGLDNTSLTRFLNDIRTAIATMSAIRSIQTAYETGAITGGAGEDTSFRNVAITAVLDTAKCTVLVQTGDGANYTGRLTSTTNLRLARPGGGAGAINARWYVVEYV
jgi:hypothetical protein